MGPKTSKIAVIAAVATLWPTFASPQQGGGGASGGVQIDIGVSSKFTADSNFTLSSANPGTSYISDTKLSFGLTSRTSAYDFSLTAGSTLRFADIPGRSVAGLEDPTLKLRFVADSSNSRLTLTGGYRFVDREFLNPFQVEREEQQLGTLVGNGGTLRDKSVGLKYEAGLNAPLGFILDLSHSEKDYENVASTSVKDTTRNNATGTVRFKLSPVATGRFVAGLTNQKTYQASNNALITDRTTTDYSVGVTYEINPILSADAQIGFTDVETVRTSGVTNASGLTGAISLTRSLPNGTLFGTLSSTQNQNGQRVSLSFGRDLQLPNGSLKGTLGVTKGDTGNSSWIGSLSYSKQFATDAMSVSINRSASTNANDDEVVDTRVGVTYSHPINDDSRLGLNFDWGQQKDTGATTASTTELTSLQATYSYDLTSEWSLQSGIEWRKRVDTDPLSPTDASSTSVFVQLGRNFSFRP